MSSPVQDKQEYGLGVTPKPKMSNMAILKRSDMWITDSGAPNHVTFMGSLQTMHTLQQRWEAHWKFDND
jgi:hypothetical protein